MKVVYKDIEVTAKSFRELTDQEIEAAGVGRLPQWDVEPAELEGAYYLKHPDHVEGDKMVAFIIPTDLVCFIEDTVREDVKRKLQNVLDEC